MGITNLKIVGGQLILNKVIIVGITYDWLGKEKLLPLVNGRLDDKFRIAASICEYANMVGQSIVL